MTNEAYIFDSIRSPRGKRKNGSLNEITPTDLLSKLMLALSIKHDFDTSRIDDVVIGCDDTCGSGLVNDDCGNCDGYDIK